jgi:hypothetical protein
MFFQLEGRALDVRQRAGNFCTAERPSENTKRQWNQDSRENEQSKYRRKEFLPAGARQ